jgi:hypothetical protein
MQKDVTVSREGMFDLLGQHHQIYPWLRVNAIVRAVLQDDGNVRATVKYERSGLEIQPDSHGVWIENKRAWSQECLGQTLRPGERVFVKGETHKEA